MSYIYEKNEDTIMEFKITLEAVTKRCNLFPGDLGKQWSTD